MATSYPQFHLPFIVATDASGCAIGAVLSQEQEKVIAYWSRQLSKAERNYSTIEREAPAVVAAIKEFFPFLYGKSINVAHRPQSPYLTLWVKGYWRKIDTLAAVSPAI